MSDHQSKPICRYPCGRIFCQEYMYRASAFLFSTLLLLVALSLPAGAQDQDFSDVFQSFGPSYVKDTIPDRLQPGQSYPVLITFRNGGLVTWERKNHRVGLVYAGNITEVVGLPAFVDIPEKSKVFPGQTVTFATSLLPVGLPGQYQLPFYVSYRTALGDQQVTEIWTKTVTIVPSDGVSSPLNGSIVVDSVIGDLNVSFSGVSMGPIPCIIPDVPPGNYEIQITSNGTERWIPVTVKKGTMSRVYIPNFSDKPLIELKKINIISNGTLFGYIEANVPLVILVVALVIGCIALMVHGVRLRREKEAINKKEIRKKTRGKQKDDEEDDPAQLEKDLLEKYHDHPPLFSGGAPGADPGSGSSAGQMKIDVAPGPMKNVRIFTREMLDASQEDKAGGLSGSAGKGLPDVPAGDDVDISLTNLNVRPGSAMAHFGAVNRSTDPYSVDGVFIGPGGHADIPVEVGEPITDEYEITLTLKISSENGQHFLRKIPIPYNRGMALLARGVLEKAYEYFHLFVRKNPGNRDALLHKVDVLTKWGLEEETAIILSQILQMYPDDSEAHDAINQIAANKAKREKLRGKPDQKPKISGFPDSLDERYTAIRLLGKDAFASIILVLRKDTGDLRVLKVAHEGAVASSSLYTEISVLYQLRHQNVLKMFRAEFNPTLFLELEYASGVPCQNSLCRTLADLSHPVEEDIIITLIEQIAMGLAYMHMKGVRHYKLSPKHILLDEPMTPKISGFIQESLSLGDSKKQEHNFVLAPEQILPASFGKLGKRTDIFQMGVVWYWLLTGKVPFPDGAVSVTKDGGYVAGVYISPGMINPKFSPYDPLMKRLLALDKRERYSSADEFLAELRGIMMISERPDHSSHIQDSSA